MLPVSYCSLRYVGGKLNSLAPLLQPLSHESNLIDVVSKHLSGKATSREIQEGFRKDDSEVNEANSQRLIRYWQKAISNRQSASEDDIRKLLHTAAQIRLAKAPRVTEQLLQVVMDLVKAMAERSEEKERFLSVLVSDFGVETAELDDAVAAYKRAVERKDLGEDGVLRAHHQLRRAVQPLYRSLFVPMSNQPGGIKFLVDLRADVLAAIRKSPSNAARLRALSDSIRDMAQEWFSVGLLHLERITWERSPAVLLQKVMEYESVHPYEETRKWEDLQQRLGPLRRVYGFFHASMPGEPLVLLHTALMPKISSSLECILGDRQSHAHQEDEHAQSGEVCSRPEDATAAVFYSISASQNGLSGIDLGNFLIKKVARKLVAEFPNIQQLSTLSPIPGFSAWFTRHLERSGLLFDEGLLEGSRTSWQQAEVGSLLTAEEAAAVRMLWGKVLQQAGEPSASRQDLLRQLGTKLAGAPKQDSDVLRAMLLRLVAHYLLREKRRGMALDPVANFHLRNGAEVMRLNWQAGGKSTEASYGIMVNYRYDLDRISANNRAYLQDGIIVASSEVQQLLRTSDT